ncbi:MAG: DUF4167 domain-containing protein [Alphaproteobacteria bacterium]|nr:DUF4167 domain-containing protein [Alphaproteobacteria bacterium]
MRQTGKNNRQRGRGRRNGHNGGQINRNTTIDSNGPDVRIRGNAQQLHEKYIALANDASAAGERIQAEAYFQFADHYFRVNAAIIAAAEERRDRQQDHTNRATADDKSADDKSDDDNADEAQAKNGESDDAAEAEVTAAETADEANDEDNNAVDVAV